MRHGLLLLMIAVLCLRVWGGEAMAAQMINQQLALNAPASAAAHHGSDCPGATDEDAESGMAHACASCLACQDCSLNALLVPSGPLGTDIAAPAAPAPQRRFSSAEPQQGHKPPIA